MTIPVAERIPGRLREKDLVPPEELRESGKEKIESSQQVIELLEAVVREGLSLSVKGRQLGPEEFRALLEITRRPSERSVVLRRGKIERMTPGFNSLVRWLGARIGELRTGGGGRFFPKSEWYGMAGSLLERLPRLAETPFAFVPKEAPEEEVLKEEALESARGDVVLSVLNERIESVPFQLLNPVKSNRNGLVILPKSDDEVLNFTVPSRLLEILRSLKHPESEEVFRKWIYGRCTSEEANAAEDTITFLRALVNFAGFLDSRTHLELFEPPEVPGRGEEEILLQPFNALLHSVRFTRTELSRKDPNQEIIRDLQAVEDLIRLRYVEVFSGVHETSLYTVGIEALIPSPEAFAQWAFSMTESYQDNGQNLVETASALVKLAESIGVEDINPLIAKMDSLSDLKKTFIEKAERAGLIPYPEAIADALKALKENPWQDPVEMDFAKIIGVELGDKVVDPTDVEVYVFTGTFGPFTKGHKDLLEKLLTYIDLLPQIDGDRIFQRLVLIVPVTDILSIPRYEKNAAQIGPIDARIGSIMLQLAGEVDPKKVLITTKLQPDPAKVRDLAERVFHTVRYLETKIFADLSRAERAAGFELTPIFAFGPDEIRWKGSPRQIDLGQQRRKVKQPGGICIVRRGWLSAVLREHKRLTEATGIEMVNLTPGIPYHSSSEVVKEIGEKGDTRAVEAPAREFVLRHWSKEIVKERETSGLRFPVPIEYLLSAGTIYQRLIEELESQLGQE